MFLCRSFKAWYQLIFFGREFKFTSIIQARRLLCVSLFDSEVSMSKMSASKCLSGTLHYENHFLYSKCPWIPFNVDCYVYIWNININNSFKFSEFIYFRILKEIITRMMKLHARKSPSRLPVEDESRPETCTDLYRLVQTCTDLYRLVQTCTDLYRLVQTCTDLYKLVQTCTNLSTTTWATFKFQDIIKLEQMKIIFEFKSNSLPLDLNNLFQENKEINCHFTRNVTKEGLYIPQIRTKTYGSKSIFGCCSMEQSS